MVTATLHHTAASSPSPVARWMHKLWQVMVDAGRARAEFRLEQMARSYEASQPELARVLRGTAHDLHG
jgi:hypothetical protein